MADLTNKTKLLCGLLTGEKSFIGPISVNIDVTHRCNLKCIYCRWHSSLLEQTLLDPVLEKDISPEVFARLCGELKRMGTQTLLFVGAGEPLLHPRIFDLIAVAKELGFEVVMYTNGVTLTDRICEKLVELRLDVLRVSLKDSSAEEFEANNPQLKPGTYAKILDHLRLLADLKAQAKQKAPRVELCVPVDRNIMHDLEKMTDMARRTGCDRMHFSVVIDFGLEELKGFTLTPEEVTSACRNLRRVRDRLDTQALPHNIDDALLRFQLGESVWEKIPCYNAWLFTFVRTDGKVLACQRSQVVLGDLEKNSFGEIWNGAMYRDFRRQVIDRNNLDALNDSFHCSYCPNSVTNHRVHRYFRWFAPVQKSLRGVLGLIGNGTSRH
jgi:MoaA/NifB/PqqE/SkfB family radical SAM enzyme